MTIEGYEGERILVSYDVSGSARSVAARVCQIVFGRSGARRPRLDERKAEGFIWRPGVVWIGQSVLVLPPRDAKELAERLRRLGVRVAEAPVSIGRSSLEAFRRRRAPNP
ncbi:MAG: hypothetical protein ACREDF_05495 [Thermoplasmata archaeon]